MLTTIRNWLARTRLASSRLGRRDRLVLGTGVVVAVVGLVAGALLVYRGTHRGTQVYAYFAETVGVYPGSTVRILGVPVGTVDSVQPHGTVVRVAMTINPGISIPATADAVVIAPSVIADRYIQLTPPYTRGPVLADGAVIPVSRTAVPAEIDQVYASLAKLATALGPNGANSRGALTDLIKSGAANLTGNGSYLKAMLTQFSGLSKALGGSAGNLFASLAYLQQFTSMLKHNDGQVRLAEQQLAQVTAILASDRQDLSAAISELAVALGQVKGFIGGNRALLTDNVRKLAAITSVLVAERASLAQALDVVPLVADNFVGAYDSAHQTLNGRGNLNELIFGTLGSGAFTASYSWPAGSVPVPASQLGSVPPLPLPVTGSVYATPQALLAEVRR